MSHYYDPRNTAAAIAEANRYANSNVTVRALQSFRLNGAVVEPGKLVLVNGASVSQMVDCGIAERIS